jgi:hypothetical protein
MNAIGAAWKGGSFPARLPQPVMALNRHEYTVCLMLELLDKRLEKIERGVKDFGLEKDLGPFSKAYTEAMTFMDTTYIFVRCLLDDVAGVIEYFYKAKKIANLPQSFDDLLKKSQKGGIPQELTLLLQPCREWFPELKKERDGIIHEYETKLIGFVRNPKKCGWTSIQFSGKSSAPAAGVGIRTYVGVLLADYQCFIDDLLDFLDRKFGEWYGIVISRNSRTPTILDGKVANMLLWAADYGGYKDEEMIISR